MFLSTVPGMLLSLGYLEESCWYLCCHSSLVSPLSQSPITNNSVCSILYILQMLCTQSYIPILSLWLYQAHPDMFSYGTQFSYHIPLYSLWSSFRWKFSLPKFCCLGALETDISSNLCVCVCVCARARAHECVCVWRLLFSIPVWPLGFLRLEIASLSELPTTASDAFPNSSRLCWKLLTLRLHIPLLACK